MANFIPMQYPHCRTGSRVTRRAGVAHVSQNCAAILEVLIRLAREQCSGTSVVTSISDDRRVNYQRQLVFVVKILKHTKYDKGDFSAKMPAWKMSARTRCRTLDQEKYAQLVAQSLPIPPRTERENERLIKRLSALAEREDLSVLVEVGLAVAGAIGYRVTRSTSRRNTNLPPSAGGRTL